MGDVKFIGVLRLRDCTACNRFAQDDGVSMACGILREVYET